MKQFPINPQFLAKEADELEVIYRDILNIRLEGEETMTDDEIAKALEIRAKTITGGLAFTITSITTNREGSYQRSYHARGINPKNGQWFTLKSDSLKEQGQ